MQIPIPRTLLAGLAGGAVLNLVMVFTFRLVGFGWNGGGILLNPSVQSQKLITVWTRMEPLPLVVTRPAPIITGLMLFGMGHAVIYRWLSPSWPPGCMARAIRLAALIFFLSFVFWEFFTPFNQFGEPFLLIALELVFWAIIALSEACTIACILEVRTTHTRTSD
ncbi:MAG: hypothetical protein L3J18_05670 [Candidatus Brocadia sp.]|nr:hypothetical protein [Candidatus Brocadia fulgida]UJS21798.1 MAG: hypothetical protein L3J18_05670 [Candidatus Brocadia sp.]